ncbi:MAG: hypothetical protein B9S32_13785 [Verrucomicrobia bacterium Tous-C9LFEB]|nr:MAG: hypothetical protein B9S32_13785 [Verrucomicrobia bacterium Tous-C9LFEB]
MNIRLKQHAEAFDKAAADLKTEHAAQLIQRMEDHLRTQLWSRGAHGLIVRVAPSTAAPGMVTITLSAVNEATVVLNQEDCDRLLEILYHRVSARDVLALATELKTS